MEISIQNVKLEFGQVIRIDLDHQALDPKMTVSELFSEGKIEIMVINKTGDTPNLLITTAKHFNVETLNMWG